MENIEKNQEEMKQRLGCKYIGENVTLTDNTSQRKFKIVSLNNDGLTIREIVSLGKGEETNLSYEDLLDKFDKSQIDVAGYEHSESDKIIFHQVIREIMSGHTLAEKENVIFKKDNEINELVTEEGEFKHGGVVGKVKSNKHGIVTEIRNQFGKIISEVRVGDKIYNRNPVYKTYNSTDQNELLRKEDSDKIKIAKKGIKVKAKDKDKQHELEEDAKNIINNEIHAVQSSLVEKLLSNEIIPYDDIQNYYHYRVDNKLTGSEEYMSEDELSDYRGNIEAKIDELENEEKDTTEWQEHLDKVEYLESEPQEIYEWWLISDWLKAKLLSEGEPIIDNEYGIWWGRTSSGQMILADGIIQRILKKINVEKYKKGKKIETAKYIPQDTTYNGWKNYETWNVKLWIDNEQSTIDYWNERADEIYKEAKKSEYSTKKQEASHNLADELQDYFDENNPLEGQASTYSDLLSSALQQVSWREIAENILHEKKERGGKTTDMSGMKIILTGLSKDISEDSYEEGQNPDSRQHILYEKNIGSFDTAEDLISFLHKKYSLSNDKKNYTAFEDGRITYSQMEDYDGSSVDEKDSIYKEWKKGKAKLYSADYNIYIEVGEIKTPSVDEIAKMFGIKTYNDGGKMKRGGKTIREFRYLKLIPKNNGLEIQLTKEGEEKIKEDGLTYDNAPDYFEDVQGNSEYIYHDDLGESGFGLTNSEGITDGYYFESPMEFLTDHPQSAKVYWFPNYQIQFWGDILKDEGSVFFIEAKIEESETMKKGGRVDITSNFYRFRQHSPKGVTECAVPQWGMKVAESVKSGAEITTCKKDGKWFVQSIMIPKDGINASKARKLANEIKSKFHRKKKALGGVAETCTCEDIEKTKNGLRVLIDTSKNESDKKKYEKELQDLD